MEIFRFPGTDARLDRCFAVRRAVFIQEQGVAEHEEIDGRDAECVHFLATQADGTDLGCARSRLAGPTVMKAERVAVHAVARGMGVGRALMRALEDAARAGGATRVRLGAQVSAIPFYVRLGYTAEGPEFMDAGIPHRWMELPL